MTNTQDQRRAGEAERVRHHVREGYTAVAEGRGSLAVHDTETQARAFGYEADALQGAAAEANLGLGCGNPAGRAALMPGEVVLDIGCGAGIDIFIASRAVGPTGRAIGVDMTLALVNRARETAARERSDNIEFRLGTMESLPVDDASIDVVLSNCAINLSPEKHLVFAEAARVLRPGGRIQLSDLVVERELPAEIRASVEAYVGCVGGAIKQEEYAELVSAAGFTKVKVAVEFSLSDIIEPDDPRVAEILADAGLSYPQSEIREALAGIKSLSVSAVTAADSGSCCAPTSSRADAPADSGYTDLLSYVLSNAVAGEIMAVENYSDMVALLPDVDAKLAAVDQAREEGKHIRQLASLGNRVGFDVKQRIIEPEWKAIRATFREAVANNDLAACLVIQDLMTESMAIVLYRTLAGDQGVATDDLTAHVASTILDDELEHLESGIAQLRALRAQDPTAVDAALMWAHPRVMPQLFSLVDTSCESLCDELSVECSSLDPSAIGADLGKLRATAAMQYAQALDAVGFPTEMTSPLMSQLASLDHDDPHSRVEVGPVPGCC